MKERFDYIDIFRGICMFTVIYSHILLFCIGYKETSLLTNFLRGFYLNSFFFISGFVSYKIIHWSLSNTRQFLYKKIKTLLIPSFISLGVYCFFTRTNYSNAILETTKSGYWFTFVLFEMFFLYAIYSYITNTIKNKKWQTFLLIFLALASYLLNKLDIMINPQKDLFNIRGLLYYIPLFWIGIACRINIELFHKIIDLKYIKIILFIVVLMGLKTNVVPLIIYSISSTLFVYTIIKDITRNKPYGKVKKYASNILKAIGQNTLQIYFLHYFLLFKYPESIINYMQKLYSDGCLVGYTEFIMVGSICILISFTCIYIAKILNYVPYVNTLMFGHKITNTNSITSYSAKKQTN